MDLEITRHSLAHVLALAVKRLYGNHVKFGTGPATETGFFYDFELAKPLSKDDFGKIQAEMEKIVKENLSFKKKKMPIAESQEYFKVEEQPYKLHLLKKLEDEGTKEVTHFMLGEFEDLCAGPHLKKTGEIKIGGFALNKIAGAYWQGNEENPMLTRISGLAFADKKALKKYLADLEEAKKRDHKKLGRELDLFSFHEEAPGSAYWHPRGMILWNELEKYGKEIRKEYGYKEIQTPQLAKASLWMTSGHWDHYKNEMFHFDVDKEVYCFKPMDCPFNIQIYQTATRSYRDLPIRYTEIGRVLRNEKSGQLNGLFRVRTITQDDAHVFLGED